MKIGKDKSWLTPELGYPLKVRPVWDVLSGLGRGDCQQKILFRDISKSQKVIDQRVKAPGMDEVEDSHLQPPGAAVVAWAPRPAGCRRPSRAAGG